jgi:hypothetical protein
MDRQAGGKRHPQELGVELGRVRPADVHPDRAATAEVGADEVALLGMWNGVKPDPQSLGQRLCAACHALVLFISDGPSEQADQPEVAVELFGLDEIVEEFASDRASQAVV